MIDHEQFVQGYSKVIGQSWADEQYMARLLKDPKSVLAEVGLTIPQGAQLNVVRISPTGQGKIENQVALWEAGERTGIYELRVPDKSGDLTLSDEQLSAVAGGAASVGDINCCCCPCCCCT